jgi:tetratricopeptide (TPR) repeat protein
LSGLQHSLGILGLLALLVCIVRIAFYRDRASGVVAAAFLLIYGSISWGQLSFARYALPLLPLMAVLAAGGIGFVQHRGGQIALMAVLTAGPLYGSVRTAQLVAREDVRLEARRWIEGHVPAGTTCCNFAGWAGDVPLRTYSDHWWRLLQFEGSFCADSVGQTIDFLSAVKPKRPFYIYAVQTGNRFLEHGSWELVNEWRCAYVLLHRHPLSYSQIDTAFAAALAKRGQRVGIWRPEGLSEAEPLYDSADAYYLPLADFGPLQQPGPEIEIWRLDEHPENEQAAQQGAREIFAHAYLAWAGTEHHKGQDADARRFLQKALDMAAADPLIYNEIGIEYRKLKDYQAALMAWDKGLKLAPNSVSILYNYALTHQVNLDNPAAAIPHWHRAIASGEVSVDAYAHLANAYMLSNRRSEAVHWLGQVLEKYPNSPHAQKIREQVQAQEGRP